MSEPRVLVDRLIDHGLHLSPATDWSLTLPTGWLDLLPLDGDRLERPVDTQRAGYYRTPVYRNVELVPQPLARPVIILADASGLQPTVFLHTGTGQIGTSLTAIGLGDGQNREPS